MSREVAEKCCQEVLGVDVARKEGDRYEAAILVGQRRGLRCSEVLTPHLVIAAIHIFLRQCYSSDLTQTGQTHVLLRLIALSSSIILPLKSPERNYRR